MIRVITRRFYETMVKHERKGHEPTYVAAIEVHEFRRSHRIHERPEYSALHVSEVARWLNDREAGYPVPGHIKHLWNPHYESPRQKTRNRRRPAQAPRR